MTKPLTFSSITRRGLTIVQQALAFIPEDHTLAVTPNVFQLLNSKGRVVIEADTEYKFATMIEEYITNNNKHKGHTDAVLQAK
jgi:hypothetical protein